MEWFKIEWNKCIALRTAENRPDASNKGVYAIYEVQRKLPQKVLYIGETYTQTFGRRLKQHKKDWLFRYEDIDMAISFGVIRPSEGKRITQGIVFDCERILICRLIPPCNTSGKKRYTGRDIMVFNTGKNTSHIPPIVTNDLKLLSALRTCADFLTKG